MEGIVQLRMELSYSIYHIKDKCGEECEENLLKSIMIMLMTVSYTHLTLPTNREV